MQKKRVLILGGGIGGVSCARELKRRLSEQHEVTLIDQSAQHIYAPALLRVAFGAKAPRTTSFTRPLLSLNRFGVDFRQARVEEIRVSERTVVAGNGEVPFDYLVVAMGAALVGPATPGLSEAADIFYELDGALRTREALARFGGGKVVIAVCALPFKCPAAPYEAAFLTRERLARSGLLSRSSIEVVTPEPLPMPTAGPVVGEAIRDMLASRGIGFRPNISIGRVNAEARELELESGESVPFDLLIAIPPHRPPEVVAASELAGQGGWISVDPTTLETTQSGVFAIGDVTAIKLPNDRMLPKAGVFAHAQAAVVAAEIAFQVKVGDSVRPERRSDGATGFDGRGSCFLQLDDAHAGFARGSFYEKPGPRVRLYSPGRRYAWAKSLVEKWWLWRHF